MQSFDHRYLTHFFFLSGQKKERKFPLAKWEDRIKKLQKSIMSSSLNSF